MNSADHKRKQLHILLVEDSPTQAKIVEFATEGLDAMNILHVAEDGVEAMAYLRRQHPFEDSQRPDVILCDINMPRKNGLEVLEDVKADGELCKIPFVMLTTSGHEEDIAKSYVGGASTFISKPFDIDGLERVLERFAHYWTTAKYAQDDAGKMPMERESSQKARGLAVDDFMHCLVGSDEIKSVDLLVVEDNVPQARLIEESIRGLAKVNLLATIRNGKEALAYLRREGDYRDAQRPNLVLLDINLPQKDGFQVLGEMKADDDIKRIPVVVLTVRDDEEDIVQCYKAGASTFFKKPIDPDGLKKVLARFGGYWADEATRLPRNE